MEQISALGKENKIMISLNKRAVFGVGKLNLKTTAIENLKTTKRRLKSEINSSYFLTDNILITTHNLTQTFERRTKWHRNFRTN